MDFKVPTYCIVQLEHSNIKPALKHKNSERRLCNCKNGDTLLLQERKKKKRNLFLICLKGLSLVTCFNLGWEFASIPGSIGKKYKDPS